MTKNSFLPLLLALTFLTPALRAQSVPIEYLKFIKDNGEIADRKNKINDEAYAKLKEREDEDLKSAFATLENSNLENSDEVEDINHALNQINEAINDENLLINRNLGNEDADRIWFLNSILKSSNKQKGDFIDYITSADDIEERKEALFKKKAIKLYLQIIIIFLINLKKKHSAQCVTTPHLYLL